jgi:ornithine carbamoyltransferase
VAYVGDFNNVARSLAIGAAMMGMHVRIGCPPGHAPSPADVDRIHAAGSELFVTHRADEVAVGADVVYADVWASMGQESEAATRKLAFEGFTIDDALMERARPDAVFLHCLPAHRGEEVSASVCDGPQSLIWELAENRMHAQRGLLVWLLEQAGV